ncbi:WASH complex subunit 1-like [Acanthaster planci]|uniref:WASH complex subunit 1-like n=1 Tax=Acanthaster planci TaxID=133434 RepID=A0A8B7XPA1_ACAPL|nr:WASH complex subunit 1-like [Acanthaster planci]
MESFDASISVPVISCPSSPEPSDELEEVYQGLTVESIHCALAEREDSDKSPPLERSASFPDRTLANHNFSGRRQQRGSSEDSFDETSTSTLTPPPSISPDPPPSSPPNPAAATPTGITQTEMRMPSPDRMYLDMVGDLEVMMDIAKSMHELARHTKSLLHAAYERVDLGDPRVRNLGMAGVLKDLRLESAHSVVDGQRAQLRYEKVLADVRRLRRCLRNLGFWRLGGASLSTAGPPVPPPAPDTTWGLPHHSYLSHDIP